MNTFKKLMIQKILSVLIGGIGVILMTYMIYVENEPGAIPLLLIMLGGGWYLITRFKIQSQHT